MSSALDELIPELRQLPRPDRAAIALAMLESLNAGPTAAELDSDDELSGSEYEAVWAAELARRFGKIEDGTARGRPADEVIRDLRKELADLRREVR